VVVGDQECAGDSAHDPDLVPHVHDVRPSRRLDLANDLESAHRHGPTIGASNVLLLPYRQAHRPSHTEHHRVANRRSEHAAR